jgi:hypothetical protein
MNAISRNIGRLVLAATVAGAALAATPAAAADPSITLDSPAAGTVYANDVPSGSVGTGNAVSIGKSLTLKVTWNCPSPPATTAHVELTVKNAAGAVVYNMGMLVTTPSGSTSRTWTHDTSGTYTVETKVTCIRVRQTPNGPVSDEVGADTDSRTVVVIAA